MARTHLIVVFFGLLLGGCVPPNVVVTKSGFDINTPQEKLEALAAAPVCCRQFSEMKAIPLQDDLQIELDARSPAFQFPSGKSFFAALTIDKNFLGKTLQVRAYATLRLDTYFGLAITLLDGNYRVLAVYDSIDGLRHNRYAGDAIKIRDAYIERVITLPSEARYVVVHTTDALMRVYALDGMYYFNSIGPSGTVKYRRQLMPTGEVRFRVIEGGVKYGSDK
ncbi:MAG: hypothetical protein ACK5TK_14225 [Betaproteobacteria bacterium]